MADSRIYDVLEEILADVGGGGTPLVDRVDALEALVYQDSYNKLAAGQSTLPRSFINTNVSFLGSSNLRLSYFTAVKSETSTQVRIISGSTAAAATPTLVRFGLYSVAANGDGTLVAATTNDTSLLAATATAYTKAWASPYNVVAGTRYAFGVLVVSGATMPLLVGSGINDATEVAIAPRITGAIGGQADLPASFLAGSVGLSGSRIYAAILP